MYKNTLLLLIAGALIASVYTHDASEAWKCNHDQVDHPELTFIDMEETGFQDAQAGRRLQEDDGSSYPNIRMYAYYGFLSSQSSTYQNYIQNELIPPILSYFEGALRVKYPVSGSFTISSNSICSKSTPSVLRNGVSADYIYLIDADYDTGKNWVASSSTCSLASGTKRPLVGITTVNSNLLKATTDVLLHEKNMICLMHEITHTLGFSNTLFPHFIDSNGNKLSNPVIRGTLGGSSMQIINVSPLKERLQNYFGCSSLQGAYMENSGSEGTAGSHFERRQFAYEAMTSGLIYEMQYSEFTLAMLESSGWYVPDYSYADPFFFGQGQGCNFLTQSCSSSGSSFSDFCTGSSRGCATPGRGAGYCGSDSRSDNCKFIHPDVGLDCGNANAGRNARLGNAEAYGRGLGSKCFMGTLGQSRAGSNTNFCLKYSCDNSGSSTVLNVEVGSTTVECTSEGVKTVSGYAGTISCPDPLTFCKTVGQWVCPRGCMGRGNCYNGVCACYRGYKGEDCALNDGSSIN